MIQFMKILGPVVVCIMIHRFLKLPIGIRRDDFRVDEPFDVGTFGREQAVDIIRAQDAVRGMIVVEPVDPLDPVGVPLPFSTVARISLANGSETRSSASIKRPIRRWPPEWQRSAGRPSRRSSPAG